ncbi:MAG: hypothetical protein H0W76_16950 [Pyrinomonadaceae bacterium]|nr:hypothetical protein [Pyrinomonadaceae bacterium]
MMNAPTKILEWSEVEPIFRFYISVWANHITLNWASSAWQMLHIGGLTVFNNDEEELKVRSYAVALSVIYYEYCHRTAFHECEQFSRWDDSKIKTFKREFLPDLEKDDELIFRVKKCLLEQQSNDLELCSKLWINCAESYQGFVFSIGEKAKLQDKLIKDFNDDFNFNRGKSFILGSEIDDISCYESVSGL